jgi:hypothetical protein
LHRYWVDRTAIKKNPDSALLACDACCKFLLAPQPTRPPNSVARQHYGYMEEAAKHELTPKEKVPARRTRTSFGSCVHCARARSSGASSRWRFVDCE